VRSPDFILAPSLIAAIIHETLCNQASFLTQFG